MTGGTDTAVYQAAPEETCSADGNRGNVSCDCHIHIFMDGLDYRKARDRHRDGVDERVIREHLSEYSRRGITWLRDGGDALGVSERAARLAPEYGITYRTPVFAIHKKGHYGSIVGRDFETMEDYAALVREVRNAGGHFIKIMTTGIMDFSRAGRITGKALAFSEVKEMVHIAHEEGFAVMAHTNGAEAVRDAALAGVDSVEHGNFQTADSLQAMAACKTVWVPTLVTVSSLEGKGRFPDSEIRTIMETQKFAVRTAKKLGVSVASGTDAGAWMVPHGTSLAQEYDQFSRILEDAGEAGRWLASGNAEIRRRF